MKKRTALFLATLLIVAGVVLAGDNPIVGTWQSASGNSIKIYTETHFAVVNNNSEDGTFGHAAAGEIVVKGNKVTEKILKSSNPDAIGAEFTHEFTISGDDWESTVTYPDLKSSDSPLLDGRTVKEVWKRVK